MSSAILKVGFEVEGGWEGTPGISPFKDITLISDHSINGQTLTANPIVAPHVGEAVSPPLSYADEDWKGWLEEHWPNAAPPNRTNHTCGFHIHASFGSMKDYTLLTSKVFLLEVRDHLLKVGEEIGLPRAHDFWRRMLGKNTFCTLTFDATPQIQLLQKGGGIHRVRYGWLNFSWNVHGTMEFRALPTFRDATTAVKFANAYFTFVDSWLDAHRAVPLRKEFTF